MDDICTYQIKVRGLADEDEVNAISPLRMATARVDTTATLFTIRTDQSGLIGLMRHLHGRGFVFVSVSRVDTDESAARLTKTNRINPE